MVWLWALVHLIWTATLTSADAVVRLDNVTFPSYILDHPLVLVKCEYGFVFAGDIREIDKLISLFRSKITIC